MGTSGEGGESSHSILQGPRAPGVGVLYPGGAHCPECPLPFSGRAPSGAHPGTTRREVCISIPRTGASKEMTHTLAD